MARTEVYARFEYVCEHGHSIGADRPYTRCPVATCGSDRLTRFGHGSKPTRANPINLNTPTQQEAQQWH